MFYNCIEAPKPLTTEEAEKLYLESMANRIEVKELDFSEFMLTSDEYEYFLPYFLKY